MDIIQTYESIQYAANNGKWIYDSSEKKTSRVLDKKVVNGILTYLNQIDCWTLDDVEKSYCEESTLDKTIETTSQVMSDELIAKHFGKQILDYGCFKLDLSVF